MPNTPKALVSLLAFAASLGLFATAATARPDVDDKRLYRSAPGEFRVSDRPISLALEQSSGDGFDDLLIGTAGRDRLHVLEIVNGRVVARPSWGLGVTPTAIGVDARDEAILVASRDSQKARELDLQAWYLPSQESYETRIAPGPFAPVGLEPVAVLSRQISVSSSDPEGGRRYGAVIEYLVANRGSDDLSLLGRARFRDRLALLGRVPVGDAPVAIAAHEGYGPIYVANSRSGTLTQLDPELFEDEMRAETIAVGGEPVAVGLGNLVWGDQGDEEIAVLDRARSQVVILDRPPWTEERPLQPYEVVQRHRVGRGPVALVVAELDDRYGPDVAVVNSRSDDVSILLNTGARLADGGRYPTGRRPVAIAPIGYGPYFGGDLAVANRDSDDLTILVRNEFGRCAGRPARLRVGTASGDRLGGEHGRNETRGLGGDDIVFSGEERDCLRGDDGDDLLISGSGDDLIWPGAGADEVKGQSGNDTVYARGGGSDLVKCDSGVDTVYADRSDTLRECERTP